MAHPLTKKVAKRLLYTVRAKSKQIYIALGRNPANLEPTVEPGAQKGYLFTYLLGKIISDGKTTKEDLVEALKSTSVRHGKLADDLKKDKTIRDGSVITVEHLDYLDEFLQDTIGRVEELAEELEINLDAGTVRQANAYGIMLQEITGNEQITLEQLVAALRKPGVGEGRLAAEIEKEFDIGEFADLEKRLEDLKSPGTQ